MVTNPRGNLSEAGGRLAGASGFVCVGLRNVLTGVTGPDLVELDTENSVGDSRRQGRGTTVSTALPRLLISTLRLLRLLADGRDFEDCSPDRQHDQAGTEQGDEILRL